MQWRLFTTSVPEPPAALPGRSWMDLAHQPGFTQRSAMVTALVALVAALRPVASITDLGCGDGTLLARLAALGIPAWGYDLGHADVAYGQSRGLDTRCGDILRGGIEFGEMLIATEVLEHLEDPAGFLAGLPGGLLIVSSPSLETGEWHNPIHAWAWDMPGYADLVTQAGWTVAYHTDCAGGVNTFAGVPGPQRFQAIVAAR